MAEFNVRPMPGEGGGTIARHHWVVEKRCRSLSITQEAWKLLGAFAVDCGNRSEALEIITRYAWNAKLDLCSIRTELLSPEAAAKAEQPNNIEPSVRQPETCGLTAEPSDTETVDFDAPVQCSI